MTLIRQLSTQRLLDAHQSSAHDYASVTRPFQGNDTQEWRLDLVGGVVTFQQSATGRFLDAHQSSQHDYAAVTRPAQHNDTQRWVGIGIGIKDLYTFQQLSTARYLDAYQTDSRDYAAVTRTFQDSTTQMWWVNGGVNDTFYLQQYSTGLETQVNARYLDAYVSDGGSYGVVTRPFQRNETQRWAINSIAGVYTLQQVSTGRYLDAYSSGDAGAVTRPSKAKPWNNRPSQCWVILDGTIRQASTGRYLDAYEVADKDYRVVTRPAQGNESQRWTFNQPPPPPEKLALRI